MGRLGSLEELHGGHAAAHDIRHNLDQKSHADMSSRIEIVQVEECNPALRSVLEPSYGFLALSISSGEQLTQYGGIPNLAPLLKA